MDASKWVKKRGGHWQSVLKGWDTRYGKSVLGFGVRTTVL